jgi:magnesium transporter
MKQVTRWAAIIAVPAAVTGFFGQNVLYSGSGHPVGFWTSTLATVVLAVVLWVVLFHRKDLI